MCVPGTTIFRHETAQLRRPQVSLKAKTNEGGVNKGKPYINVDPNLFEDGFEGLATDDDYVEEGDRPIKEACNDLYSLVEVCSWQPCLTFLTRTSYQSHEPHMFTRGTCSQSARCSIRPGSSWRSLA